MDFLLKLRVRTPYLITPRTVAGGSESIVSRLTGFEVLLYLMVKNDCKLLSAAQVVLAALLRRKRLVLADVPRPKDVAKKIIN